MTSDRLREAIRAHDPDGEGEARVIAAARRTLTDGRDWLECCRAGRCLLAHAWNAVVDATVYQPAPERWDRLTLASVRPRLGRSPRHRFRDVLAWFDGLEDGNGTDGALRSRAAAREVLHLLGVEVR